MHCRNFKRNVFFLALLVEALAYRIHPNIAVIQLLKSALLELESGDRAAVHLVWAIGEAQGAHLDPGVGEEKVLADPCAPVCLN